MAAAVRDSARRGRSGRVSSSVSKLQMLLRFLRRKKQPNFQDVGASFIFSMRFYAPKPRSDYEARRSGGIRKFGPPGFLSRAPKSKSTGFGG